MTNLQEAKEKRDAGLATETLRRLWLWSPIAAGGALALLLLSAVALPQWLAISRDQKRLSELEDRRQQADLLRLQTLKVVQERQQALAQQQQVIELVAGKGDGATLLATLDLEARQTAVTLQLYEPTAAIAPGAPGAAGGAAAPAQGQTPAGQPARQGGKEPPPPPDPIEEAGLKKRPLMLSARGTYPQLLAFLRRMERLDLLVEQKDLSLVVAGTQPGRPAVNDRTMPAVVPEVEVKLALMAYEKRPEPKETPAQGGKAAKPPAPPG